MGRLERHEVYCRILRILEHTLKLGVAARPLPDYNRRAWQGSVERQRSELARLFEDSPSLRAQVNNGMIARAYRDAVRIVKLEHDLSPAEDCPYTVAAVLGA